jgi:bleomycin hydrolase
LEAGHPVAWGTDVSEKSFVGSKAIGVIPESVEKNLVGSDAEKWGKLSAAEKQAKINSLDSPMKEKTITQEMRQEGYDNWTTTDDHGMQIYGIAKDQHGKEYFMMKNSWGEYGPYKGFWYVSKPYVAYKTMNIVINKNAIPQDIRQKLGI